MAEFRRFAKLIILLLICGSASSNEKEDTPSTSSTHQADESKEELVQSESKDGKLEIIKQIKKVNHDGSYTIGYEADDGSFKIESRDVLGNVKGTYGYIDEEGLIKRVSYSTSNSSEVLPKPTDPTVSVVQRIPSKANRTVSSTTIRPLSSSTSAANVIQRLSKIRNFSTTSTTEKPNYSEVVSMVSQTSSKATTSPTHVVYASSTSPRILLQGRPILRSTPATFLQTQKSEGQLVKPEDDSVHTTELPLFRRLALKHSLAAGAKPVAESAEIKGNILRRQLAQEKASNFDPQQHVFTLQQSIGSDTTDVYSSSVTTGTPRPLFTTTLRPRAFLSTTQAPVVVSRPAIRYQTNYQRNVLEDVEPSTPEYAQETSTTPSPVVEATPTTGPVVQIPPNRPTPEPLVAIRHPFQRGTILVPLSQVRGRIIPLENMEDPNEVQLQNNQYARQTTQRPVQDVDPRPMYARRLPPQFTPIPVQVDENGYIRQGVAPTPYPLPVPVTPVPRYANNEIDPGIDQISPPVSTRDFQRLLQQLIIRQSRLERISALTDPRRYPEYYQPRYRPPLYQPTPVPYYAQRIPPNEHHQQSGPVRFLPEGAVPNRQRQFLQLSPQQQQEILRHQQQQREEQDYYRQEQQYAEAQSRVPSRRVARLLQPVEDPKQEIDGEYLPQDVREMLLLRMLQLAINPALPVLDGEVAESTTPSADYKKLPVRNVEILGEESAEDKKSGRNKRYRDSEADYYDE